MTNKTPLLSNQLKKGDALVIKIGSALICDTTNNQIKRSWFTALAEDLAALQKTGIKIIIVSSGGVALGRQALGIAFDTPPANIPLPLKQAASSVGQYHMYHAYHDALHVHGLETAQILLTLSETENRCTHLNARETVSALLERGIIPVINENDTISTEEIRFGDNDRLAVRVAQMMDASHVVLLSTIDGLYEADPRITPDAPHISYVGDITETHEEMAGEALPGLSTGGMKSKLQAAIKATRCGIPLIIADGQDEHALQKVISGAQRFTYFEAQAGARKTARKNWISANMKPMGQIILDAGACNALAKGSSILPVGITQVSGTFSRGDVISVLNPENKVIALGISAHHAKDAHQMIGKRSAQIVEQLGYIGRDEMIHRNDLVLV